ncbi:cysteine rich repeat-containing protein [Roseibium sp.]|uniref:cysteine rich repeat-containing protein n=1 Tax=Roseibium sp. TaxID=1936156 RepID=UPI003B52A363
MLKMKSLSSAALAIGLTVGSGVLSPASAQGVLEACETEIVEFCSTVEPGNGRVLSCLYAHETKISPECGVAFEDIADVIDGLFFTIGSTLAICAADLEKHCSDTKFGQGRLLSCLAKVQSDLEPACGGVVAEVSEGLVDD